MSAHTKDTRTRIPRTIRALAVPIILVWVAFTAAVNLLVPQVEKVGMANAVSMSPQDAPAVIAAKRMGEKFQESTSDSIAMVVLVGDQPLGRSGTPLLRHPGGQVRGRQEARGARPQLLGRHDHRRRRAEQRRQGRLRPAQPRRRPGQHRGQPLGGCRPRDRSRHPAAGGSAGLRHRSGPADHGLTRGQRPRHDQDDRGHDDRHHHHAGAGLPLGQHRAAHSRHRRHRDGCLPAARSRCSATSA